MWFKGAIGTFSDGSRRAIVADLGGTSSYPTAFFEHFSKVPALTAWDDISSQPDPPDADSEIVKLLQELYNYQEEETHFTTA